MVDKRGVLGQLTQYPQAYDASLLFPVVRRQGRACLGITDDWPFFGEDIWNAYEVSWLNSQGKPVVALMELRVPCQSPAIVESKSLKLYLGSFNQTQFSTLDDVLSCIQSDISAVVGMAVSVELWPLSSGLQAMPQMTITALPGNCLDDLPITVQDYQVNPEWLTCSSDPMDKVDRIRLHSHLLRSTCPVTGQPDWATVLIEYSGFRINPEGLLRYIISFRNNQEFHEHCVERLFMDVWRRCRPDSLVVYARYTRRGGIDINPFRSSYPEQADNLRLLRQ